MVSFTEDGPVFDCLPAPKDMSRGAALHWPQGMRCCGLWRRRAGGEARGAEEHPTGSNSAQDRPVRPPWRPAAPTTMPWHRGRDAQPAGPTVHCNSGGGGPFEPV